MRGHKGGASDGVGAPIKETPFIVPLPLPPSDDGKQ